jgi:hypothetical protein
MPSSDSLYQSIGDVEFPADPEQFDATLGAFDPARRILRALFQSAIISELSPVWEQVTIGTPLSDKSPVQDWMELEPNPQTMLQRVPGWPLLVVHRQGEAKYEERTIALTERIQEWGIHYILGPLDAASIHRLGNVFLAVGTLVALVIRQRGHKSYENGALQFFRGKGGFSSIELKSQVSGQAQFVADENATLYYATTLTIETRERAEDDLDAYGLLEGATFIANAGDSDGVIPALVIGDTSAPLG